MSIWKSAFVHSRENPKWVRSRTIQYSLQVRIDDEAIIDDQNVIRAMS